MTTKNTRTESASCTHAACHCGAAKRYRHCCLRLDLLWILMVTAVVCSGNAWAMLWFIGMAVPVVFLFPQICPFLHRTPPVTPPPGKPS